MFKAIDNLKIKTTGQIISVFLVLIAIGMLFVSSITIQETKSMAVMWMDFNTGAVKKTIALSRLRAALGYGGTIHEFKNFIIHKDRQGIVKVNSALLNVTIALVAYKSFGTNDTEQAALSDLEGVITQYNDSVSIAERLVANGASTADIDRATYINDGPAIAAMEILEYELQTIRVQSSNQVYSSITTVTNLVTIEAIVIATLISVLIIIFLWFTMARLIRPISMLGKSMQNVGDMSIREMSSMERCLDLKGPQEITELANVFNDMLDKLKVSAIHERELQGELQDAQKLEAVGQLAGGIAHEINTPAQYIGDNLKFLTDAHKDLFSLLNVSLTLTDGVRKYTDVSELVKDVDAIREDIDLEYLQEEIPSATEQSLSGINQVSRIVLAMKEFSHPGVKEMSFTDINRALENTITISRNEWKHAAKLTTKFDPNLPTVPCLAGELNQVFLNLIVNAAHAISEKQANHGLGQINVSTQSDDHYVFIRIEDDGPGIPESVQDKIFNPFFTTKEVGQGTGQGLSISRDIVVKKHGGTITFETISGKGTTFIVKIPILESERVEASFTPAKSSDDISGTEP